MEGHARVTVTVRAGVREAPPIARLSIRYVRWVMIALGMRVERTFVDAVEFDRPLRSAVRFAKGRDLTWRNLFVHLLAETRQQSISLLF